MLYSAIRGVFLPENIPIKINTLKNVLFLDKINDISFTVDGKLVILIEHQSTINPNMALRFFIYAAKIYDAIVKSTTLYSGILLQVPKPEFFTTGCCNPLQCPDGAVLQGVSFIQRCRAIP